MLSKDVVDAGTRRPRRPTSGNPVFTRLIVLVALGLLLVVLGANSMGAPDASPRFEIGEIDREPPSIASPRATEPGSGGQAEPEPEPGDSSLPLVLMLAAAALLIIGAALIVQAAVRIRYSERNDPLEEEEPDGDIVPRILEEDLTAFERHFDDAEAALLGEDASADAIIQCWLALERAASLAGRGRRLSETPSEFTAAVLHAFDTDPDDIRLVLRLYQRARYGVRAQRAAIGGPELSTARLALASLRRDIEKDLPIKRSI
ncbi:DUF4129 domain-containing protein [Arthrobacter sp. H14]|uniref:DUF4129 domain-containing protein n=1 Tax=Arthrobacter sp. H14 TaxID=1312959 RepID=UPI0004787F81|nr:DUF4129 domain-containing protein [Arthrobacter sp. H14]